MDVLSTKGSDLSVQAETEMDFSHTTEQLKPQEKVVDKVVLPFLKGKEKVLDEAVNAGLQERVKMLFGQLEGEILGFDAKKKMASAYSTAMSKPVNLQIFAEDVLKKTQEHITALAHSIQFWIEEEQATRDLWNGNYDVRWTTGGIDVGINYQGGELNKVIGKQKPAVHITPQDINFFREKMNFLPAAQAEMAVAQALIQFAQTSLKTLSSALHLFKSQLQNTEGWEAFEDSWKQLSEEQETRTTAAQELQKQHEEGLKAKYEGLAGLTHLKTQIWKTNREGKFEESADYKDYQEFENYFRSIDEILKELVSIEGELKILSSIYGDITYYKKPLINYEMLCQEVECDLERLREKFEELTKKFLAIPAYQIKAEYVRNFCQAHLKAITQKKESCVVHERHIRELLPNLQKYSLPKKSTKDVTAQATTEEVTTPTTAADFIEARSYVRQTLMNFYLDQIKLTEEVQTCVLDKEAFAQLYFRFESLQTRVGRMESLQKQHIERLERAIKQATSLKEILEELQRKAVQSNDKLEDLIQGKAAFSLSKLLPLSFAKKTTSAATGLSASADAVSKEKDKEIEKAKEQEMKEVVGTGGADSSVGLPLADDSNQGKEQEER